MPLRVPRPAPAAAVAAAASLAASVADDPHPAARPARPRPALAIQGYNEVALRASRDAAVRAEARAIARDVAEDFAQISERMQQALD